MLVLEQRRNPPQDHIARFENDDNQRDSVPIQPIPNGTIINKLYIKQMVEQENDYLPKETFEPVQTRKCDMSMYIFEEGEGDPNSKENIPQTKEFVSKSKSKDNIEKKKGE
jgi:hypothetical protein